MGIFDTRTFRVLASALVFAAVLAFIYAARKTLIIFLFAILFAYLIGPLIAKVQKTLKTTRGKSIALVYLALLIGLAVLFTFIGPRIVHEGQKLSQTFPSLFEKLVTGNIAFQIGTQRGWSYDTMVRIQHFLADHSQTILKYGQAFGARLAMFAANAWILVVIPILAVFFLKDGDEMAESVLRLFEARRRRDFVESVLNDIHLMLAHYIRAQMTLAGLSAVVYVTVLLIMRVPYAFVLGTAGGLMEFVPVVGPAVAAALIVGISLLMSYNHIFILVGFLALWRLVQDYFNSPRIMEHSLELHPLAVLFGVLTGAEIGGVVGVYLSIPAMATMRIIWREWRNYREGKFGGTPATIEKRSA